ncbi:hypothetical protein B0J17DRAFT_606296 [Rhizoctonia solani]|nr:hypothetical protein B0J17DRAFT_606296 [Rhizoctonia solani]
MINTVTTPIRRRMEDSISQVTSPYFSGVGSVSSPREVRRHASTERRKVVDPGDQLNYKTLTTSLYFTSTVTPYRRRVMASDAETFQSIENAKLRRKRRHPIVRGVTPDEPMSPPSSPEKLSQAFRTIKPTLIQERVCNDPWKIIVATTLLNKTSGKAALPIFWELIKRWPTPKALAQASAPCLMELLRPIGTQFVRMSRLIRLSNAYTMHPPTLIPELRPKTKHTFQIALADPTENSLASGKRPKGDKEIGMVELKTSGSSHISAKEYSAVQKTSPIAHLPFTGPYAIDSFRIFSPALDGGGAGARVEEQLGRITCLTELGPYSRSQDDFDEAPSWYNSGALRVVDDGDAEWRKAWGPDDKQLRRYLVWRWAIEGIEYDPETHTRRPACWAYLNKLLRR